MFEKLPPPYCPTHTPTHSFMARELRPGRWRFNRSFREEVLNAWLFNAISEVQAAADDWVVDYNEYRPHESLGDVPPVQFKPRVFNAEVSTSRLST